MEFQEIYCSNCKRIIGKYNRKYYSDDQINEILRLNHATHVRDGHQIRFRKSFK